MPPLSSYCFKATINDETGARSLTCFSPEAHSMVKDISEVMSEVEHKDLYQLPHLLTALEGTKHIFQRQHQQRWNSALQKNQRPLSKI